MYIVVDPFSFCFFRPVFWFQMVFSAKCVCTKHCTWHHGDVSAENLRVANPEELRFCSYDASRSKNRKRKICLPCRARIAVEMKCSKFEVSSKLLCIVDHFCQLLLIDRQAQVRRVEFSLGRVRFPPFWNKDKWILTSTSFSGSKFGKVII